MKKTNFTIDDIKAYLEDYNCLFWFNNAVYDEELRRFRRAKIEDFTTGEAKLFGFVNDRCDLYTKRVIITDNQFIYFNTDKSIDNRSDDWQGFLASRQQEIEVAK